MERGEKEVSGIGWKFVEWRLKIIPNSTGALCVFMAEMMIFSGHEASVDYFKWFCQWSNRILKLVLVR